MPDVTVPADPAVKDPTDAALPAAINQAIADLNANVQTLIDQGVPNGSFEFDLETSGQPDSWTINDNTGGTHQLVTASGTVDHGAQALECTTTSGGWVEAASDEFQPLEPGERVQLEFAVEATDATVRIRAQVLLYDIGQTLISTNDVYDANAGNPTSFKKFGGPERQHAAATTGSPRYYKVKLIAGESGGTVAASVRFDNVRSRVYHGPVPAARATKTTINSDTTTTIDLSGQIGDDGAAYFAQMEFVASYLSGGATFTVQGWVAGAWTTVLVISQSGMNAAGAPTVAMIPLNDSNQFRVVSSGTGGTESLAVAFAGVYGV